MQLWHFSTKPKDFLTIFNIVLKRGLITSSYQPHGGEKIGTVRILPKARPHMKYLDFSYNVHTA
jgi:hypothetical protein